MYIHNERLFLLCFFPLKYEETNKHLHHSFLYVSICIAFFFVTQEWKTKRDYFLYIFKNEKKRDFMFYTFFTNEKNDQIFFEQAFTNEQQKKSLF